jgi:mRNA-degrading endonuclease RelE of RelBE toxin-antitoxin system
MMPPGMFQVIFTPVGSAELCALPRPLQFRIMGELEGLSKDFLREHPDRFGVIRRDNRELFRYRTQDYRLYFEKTDAGILVHRVLHANTLDDFLYRSQLPVDEDEALQANPNFWKLIDEPESPPEQQD